MIKFRIYSSLSFLLKQKFRWRLTGANGEKVGASSEGFVDRAGAGANAKLTRDALVAADIDGEVHRK